MKVLVTGAAGFIGFHLVQTLIKNDVQVIGLDNINDYYDVNLKYERLSVTGINFDDIVDGELVDSSISTNYKFIKEDICNLIGLQELFKENNFTHVVNLAAQAGVRYSLENPHAYVQSNLVGFVNILECCRHNKIEHLVYASSSSVYGANSKIPFSEGDRVDNPVSLYAATKKSNELLAHSYTHLYKLPTTGLRFFTVYGPYGRPDMAPMLFANAISKGEPIKVFNNGEMERDFTYIDDIVEGVYRVMSLPRSKLGYNVLNIGNSKPIKLMDFIESIENAIGKKALKQMYPMQDGDVTKTYADIMALERVINYQPKTDLIKGIATFMDWFMTKGINYDR